MRIKTAIVAMPFWLGMAGFVSISCGTLLSTTAFSAKALIALGKAIEPHEHYANKFLEIGYKAGIVGLSASGVAAISSWIIAANNCFEPKHRIAASHCSNCIYFHGNGYLPCAVNPYLSEDCSEYAEDQVR